MRMEFSRKLRSLKDCLISSWCFPSGDFIWIKTVVFWTTPCFFHTKFWLHLAPKNRKSETWYSIKCDVGANKNAGQAFSMPRLSSHFILYKVSGFRFFNPSNQDWYLVLYIGGRIGYNVIKYYFAFLYKVENQRCEEWKYYCRMFRGKMDIWS